MASGELPVTPMLAFQSPDRVVNGIFFNLHDSACFVDCALREELDEVLERTESGEGGEEMAQQGDSWRYLPF